MDATALQPKSEWGILGRSQDCVDVTIKSTGKAIYASDIRLPGMRFAVIRRSPYLGGTIRGYDAT